MTWEHLSEPLVRVIEKTNLQYQLQTGLIRMTPSIEQREAAAKAHALMQSAWRTFSDGLTADITEAELTKLAQAHHEACIAHAKMGIGLREDYNCEVIRCVDTGIPITWEDEIDEDAPGYRLLKVSSAA